MVDGQRRCQAHQLVTALTSTRLLPRVLRSVLRRSRTVHEDSKQDIVASRGRNVTCVEVTLAFDPVSAKALVLQ